MESSDEEFVWTNTSKDDSDSEVNMPYDGESESDKSYKKKLQKELFGKLDSSMEAEEPKKRKKKLKREKSSPPAGGLDDSAAGDHILNMKVKEERASFLASRDSPRASKAEPEHTPKKKKKRERQEEHESSTTEAPDAAESPRKKKKRKRDSERTSSGDQDLIIDKFEAEETAVERRVKVNGHAQKDERDLRGPGSGTQRYTSKEFIEDDDSSDDARPAPAPASPARPRPRPARADVDSPARVRINSGDGARNIPKRITFEEPQAEPEASEPVRRISERITFKEPQYEPEPPKRARRISERITFKESPSESEPERAASPRARPPAGAMLAVDARSQLKVKEERASFLASRDSPRASKAEPEHTPKKKKKRERQEEHESFTTEAPDAAESPRKKKKRKRDSERTSAGDQDLIIDKFEAEETVVERRVKVNGHAQKDERDLRGPGSGTQRYTSKEFIEDDDSSDDARPAPAPASPARPRPRPARADVDSPARVRINSGEGARNIPKRITFEKPQAEPEASEPVRRISERITFEEPQYEPEPPKRTRRKSEKITFEEAQSESEPERAASPAARPPAAGLDRFLRAHAHLRPVPGAPPAGAAVTEDDDVWVVRAPRGLDARALAGATLAVGARSRLKVGGRALDAAPEDGAARVALLLAAPAGGGRGWRVRAAAARGVLRLRARPPRARAPPAAAAGPAEPERVPPPRTRPRHPLLGAAHERAAALAPDVRRRLAAAAERRRGGSDEADGDASEPRKKKHRKRPDPDPGAELRPETEEPEPKKRKRKHSSRAEPGPRESESRREPDSPPRKKKIKKEKKDKKKTRRDDAAVWDSERAIEESLFDF